jgi:hypothetical protein
VHDLGSLLHQPYIFLILAGIFFSVGVLWTYTGRAWVRFNGWVYRAEEPKWFWWQVIACFLGAIGCIVRFLFEASGN